MIWNIIPNEERLNLWKKLRDDIKFFTLEDQLAAIVEFCSTMPFGSRTLDYYTPTSWPSPWEILFHGSFCTSSISLLMFYTLTLLPTEKIIELFLIEDDTGVYLIPVINNQIILNYELGKISTHSEIKNDINILKKYTQSEIKSIT